MRSKLLIALLTTLPLAASDANAATPTPAPQSVEHLRRFSGESDEAFAARAFKLPRGDAHIVAADWNGVPTLFVDFEQHADTESPERPLFALQQEPGGTFRKVLVTMGETEGGSPDVAAIGFANADHDIAKELIVVLAWPEPHYGACGPIYEVRIFDEPKPRSTTLRRLPVSKHFGQGCGEKPQHFRYTTIAAVKAELKRLGY